MTASIKWNADGRMYVSHNGIVARVPTAALGSSPHHPTPTFYCTVYTAWGNAEVVFDTGLHDYEDAKRLVETLYRLGELNVIH